MTRKRWATVAVALVAVWAVGLVVAAAWSAHTAPPTVREQSELAQGRKTLDGAVQATVAAAGPGVDAQVADYRVTSGCRISLFRKGTAVERRVVLTPPDGGAGVLLDRLAERLPSQWTTTYHRAGERVSADAGEFVTVVGEVDEPARVVVTAATGCRPGDDPSLAR